MADFDFGQGFSGATGGALSGMALGGPIGAGIGGLAGLLGGGFMGRRRPPNFQDIISQRQAEIDAFSNRLESARNNVLSNYQNLQSATMARFAPQFEASLAGRGLSAGGGAFASGVGMEAAGLQSQYDAMNAQMTQKNLYDVEQQRANLFGETLGLQTTPQMLQYQQGVGQQQALGSLFGSLTGYGLNSLFNQNRPNMGGFNGSGLSSAFSGRSIFSQPGNLNLPMNSMGGGYGYGNSSLSPYMLSALGQRYGQ